MINFLAFLILLKPPDLTKLYREGKYDEVLRYFYSDSRLSEDFRNLAIVSLIYLKRGETDSALLYYEKIPKERIEVRTLDGLSFQIAELYRAKGDLYRACENYYISYLAKYESARSKAGIQKILGFQALSDSLLSFLFQKPKIALILPLSGEFADIGNEFIKGLKESFAGEFDLLDEEKLDLVKSIGWNTILVGPIKATSIKYLMGLNSKPVIWISPYSSYIPEDSVQSYSPFKSLKEETSFLVSYLVDSLKIKNLVFVRDTSWIEGVFDGYVSNLLLARGKSFEAKIVVENPLLVDSNAIVVDSEKVKACIISGLGYGSYYLYSAFKRFYPNIPVFGTSGWFSRIPYVPKYMLNLYVVGTDINDVDVLKFKDEKEAFENRFYEKYGYIPSELAYLGYDVGKILGLQGQGDLCQFLLNLKGGKAIFCNLGNIWNFSGKFRMLEIKDGSIISMEVEDETN